MTFQEAKKELETLVKGKYHTITYELTVFQGFHNEANCIIYVEGFKHFQHPTWRGCLDLLQVALRKQANPDPEEEPREEA